MKVALIIGQDGAYLVEFLLKKRYIVHGIKRRASSFNTDRIDHIYEDPHIENRNFVLHYGDMTDSLNLTRIIKERQLDERYNLAAQSHVKVSYAGSGCLLGVYDGYRYFEDGSSKVYASNDKSDEWIPYKLGVAFAYRLTAEKRMKKRFGDIYYEK